MIGEALEVAADHVARALEDHLENPRDLLRDRFAQPCRERRQQVQDLRIPCLRQVAAVVCQHRLQQWRYEALCQLLHSEPDLLDGLLGGAHLHEGLDQPEAVPLDVPHQLHVREAHGLRALLGRGMRNILAAELVDLQHVVVEAGQLHVAGGAHGADHALVGPQNQRDLPEELLVLEPLERRRRRGDGVQHHAPTLVEQLHELGDEALLSLDRGGRDHVTHGLDVSADMEVLQLIDVLRDVAGHLLDEAARLHRLHDDELLLALLANFQKGLDGHLLHARECLMHELEELEDHGLQELPMGPQEARILAHDVHNVARDHGLVLLAALHLAQGEQVLDHRNKERLLDGLVHRPADGTDGPAKPIQICRRPLLCAVHAAVQQALLRQASQHDAFHVRSIKVGQVDEGFPHHLVQSDLVGVLLLGPHDVALLVLLDRHLRGLRHLGDQHLPDLRQDRAVLLQLRLGARAVGAAVGGHAAAVEHQRHRGAWRSPRVARARTRPPASLVELQEDPRAERLPELHANLEGLLIRAQRDPHQVVQSWDHVR
mmetsp:Transcript_45691/g.133032  ORF Transcript_45691/g.133032 Transcript_45691/m.133032 type:complete len:544 (-) Transcript_45691:1018-2649(-)